MIFTCLQIGLSLLILLLLVKPLESYMARVYAGKRTFLTRVFGPVERVIYLVTGENVRNLRLEILERSDQIALRPAVVKWLHWRKRPDRPEMKCWGVRDYATGEEKTSVHVVVLISLILPIGIGAVISGPLLFLAPDGHLMKLSTDTLKGSPFPDYLIPGVILFLFVGVYPVFVAYSLLKQPRWRWPDKVNPFRRYHWAWSASLSTGIILLIWIVTETALLGYISFLQPVVAVWGIVLIVLTLLPGTQAYYKR